jgi:hypothetical protein
VELRNCTESGEVEDRVVVRGRRALVLRMIRLIGALGVEVS